MASQNTNIKGTNSDTNQEVIVGLDIGTSKICALVATKDSTPNTIKILGMGIADSDGLNRGVVVNIEKTVNSIKKVIVQAEQQSGHKITEVIVGISGESVKTTATKGIIGVPSPTHDITLTDVNRVIDECRNIKIPNERRILHVIPQDFIIDGQEGILDPVGMNGVRIEANSLIITGQDTTIHNLYRCIEKVGLKVKNIIYTPLASSYAVLNDDEKEVGVALVDVGAGTTDIAIYEDNCLRFTSSIGVAGKQVTEDIKKVLGIIGTQAERIKKEYGYAFKSAIMQDEVFMIPGINGRNPLEVYISDLSDIIQVTLTEIFNFALEDIRKSGYSVRLGAGIVLTGGSSMLKGIDELAQDVFGIPVKRGLPSSISYSGLAPEIRDPIYSTAVGLVMYGLDEMITSNNENETIAEITNEEIDLENQNEEKISFWNKLKDKLSQL